MSLKGNRTMHEVHEPSYTHMSPQTIKILTTIEEGTSHMGLAECLRIDYGIPVLPYFVKNLGNI